MALPEEVVESVRVPRIGPYSQAVRIGDLVFTAGQPGIDPTTGQVVGDTFEARARQAFAALNALFEEFFPGSPPVRSTPVVALPRGLPFSIDAIAVAEPGDGPPLAR